MSVVAYHLGCFCFSLIKFTSVYIHTRSFPIAFQSIMSNLSVHSFSSCEIAGSDYNGAMLKPQSPNVSTKSEVICSFSFKELLPGQSFIIAGIVLRSCERFSINLLTGGNSKQDIALHFNPRLPQNYIVRNSRINGVWMEEETLSEYSAKYDLFRGSQFSIEILVTESEFMMAVNGKHFGSYKHRVPFKKINTVEVKGDVKEVTIDQIFRDNYPDVPTDCVPTEPVQSSLKDFLTVPWMGRLGGSFTRGKKLHIYGKVKLLPHAFTINLQDSQFFWPHATVPLHINPRFSNQGGKHILCCNTFSNDKWMKEQRTDLYSKDLSPGKYFKMTIEAQDGSYLIYVDDMILAEYHFRCEPSLANTIYICGDIVLKSVWIENKTFK